MKFLTKRAENLIGLDIGSHFIKVVQLSKTKRGFKLENFGIAELIPEAIVEGEIMDREVVVNTITQLFEEHNIKSREVATAVSGRAVIVKRISMDKMTEEELREAVKFEAEQLIPFDIQDVTLDFQIVNTRDQTNQMDVLLVAAKNDMLTAHLDLIADAGLNPKVIDVDSFAIQNAFELNYNLTLEEIIALINIGSEVTNINVIQGGFPFFTRDISQAGKSFIEALQRKLGINYEKASGVLSGNTHPEIPVTNLHEVMSNVSDSISQSIESSFTYLKNELGLKPVNRIILSGGGVHIPGLYQYLSGKFSIPVDVINPLQQIEYDLNLFNKHHPEKVAPILTLGIGLALRETAE